MKKKKKLYLNFDFFNAISISFEILKFTVKMVCKIIIYDNYKFWRTF